MAVAKVKRGDALYTGSENIESAASSRVELDVPKRRAPHVGILCPPLYIDISYVRDCVHAVGQNSLIMSRPGRDIDPAGCDETGMRHLRVYPSVTNINPNIHN